MCFTASRRKLVADFCNVHSSVYPNSWCATARNRQLPLEFVWINFKTLFWELDGIWNVISFVFNEWCFIFCICSNICEYAGSTNTSPSLTTSASSSFTCSMIYSTFSMSSWLSWSFVMISSSSSGWKTQACELLICLWSVWHHNHFDIWTDFNTRNVKEWKILGVMKTNERLFTIMKRNETSCFPLALGIT